MSLSRFLSLWRALLVGVFLLTLPACSGVRNTPTASPQFPSTATLTTSPVAVASPTSKPSATATALPGRILLYSPKETDSSMVRSLLAEQARAAGLTLDTITVPPALPVGSDVRLAVLLVAPPNLAELVSASPGTQFIAVVNVDVGLTPNLSVIRQRADKLGFAAGLLTTMLSTDWRSGGLMVSSSAVSKTFEDGFLTGGRYFCGRCAPGWPLGVLFPVTAMLPNNADATAWQNAANDLIATKKIEALYVAPEGLTADVVKFLAGKKLALTSSRAAPEELRSLWAATVTQDVVEPLKALLPIALSGSGAASVDAPIVLRDVSAEKFGAGRQNYFESIIRDLEKGLINPLTVQ
ncbi:MAG TPA: hypothetical protein VIO61_05035 [Anaerolineaceae bacterium]